MLLIVSEWSTVSIEAHSARDNDGPARHMSSSVLHVISKEGGHGLFGCKSNVFIISTFPMINLMKVQIGRRALAVLEVNLHLAVL